MILIYVNITFLYSCHNGVEWSRVKWDCGTYRNQFLINALCCYTFLKVLLSAVFSILFFSILFNSIIFSHISFPDSIPLSIILLSSNLFHSISFYSILFNILYSIFF